MPKPDNASADARIKLRRNLRKRLFSLNLLGPSYHIDANMPAVFDQR